MGIAEAWADARARLEPAFGTGEARAMCRILFEDAFAWHSGKRDRPFAPAEAEQLTALLARVLAHEPLQYVLGQADFYGSRFAVSPAVLIPRPETEELVAWVLEHRTTAPPAARILDIGTGSGCIPITIKRHWPAATVHGADVSTDALAIAQANAQTLGATVTFAAWDMRYPPATALAQDWDIIISNPPYIPHREADQMPTHVKQHEPALALFVPDDDPLLFYRAVLAYAQRTLSAGGRLFLECSEFHAQDVHALGAQYGFAPGELRQDLQGKDRMWSAVVSGL